MVAEKKHVCPQKPRVQVPAPLATSIQNQAGERLRASLEATEHQQIGRVATEAKDAQNEQREVKRQA